MRARNVTIQELTWALDQINRKYDNNIIFRRLEQKGKTVHFTLKVCDSRGPGHRRGVPQFGKEGRRMPYACWHVHGDFFDALFAIQPKAVIITSGSLANPLSSNSITIDGGNWQDWGIGSYMFPCMMSEACDCE